jgi:hypothetical protein
MTETITTSPDIPPMPAEQKPQVKAKLPSTIAFAVGILLFLFPFIDIRCNSMSLQKVTGAELATGFKIDGPGSSNTLFNGLEKTTGPGGNISSTKNDKKDPNVYALVALALGAVGLLLSLSNLKAGGIGGLLTGALSAAALLGLLIDVRRQLKADIGVMDSSINIAVDFTPWFYISVISFVVAAFFSYKRMKT